MLYCLGLHIASHCEYSIRNVKKSMIFNGFIIRNRKVFCLRPQLWAEIAPEADKFLLWTAICPLRELILLICSFSVQPYYPAHFAIFFRFRAYTAHFANFPILCGLIMRLILIMNQIFFAYLCGQAKAFMLVAKSARHNELNNYADCPKPLFSGQILLGIAEITNYLINFP